MVLCRIHRVACTMYTLKNTALNTSKFHNWLLLTYSPRRYMAEILSIRRETLSNQSINQSINQLIFVYLSVFLSEMYSSICGENMNPAGNLQISKQQVIVVCCQIGGFTCVVSWKQTYPSWNDKCHVNIYICEQRQNTCISIQSFCAPLCIVCMFYCTNINNTHETRRRVPLYCNQRWVY